MKTTVNEEFKKVLELPRTFTRKGYDYEQILNNENMFIYRVSDKDETYYEIFKKRVNKIDPGYFGSKKNIEEGYTHRECYPGDNSFGSWAWCCRGLKSVKKVLDLHFPGHRVEISELG